MYLTDHSLQKIGSSWGNNTFKQINWATKWFYRTRLARKMFITRQWKSSHWNCAHSHRVLKIFRSN